MELKIGMVFDIEDVVEFKDTAANIGSGAMEVLSTPRMIALMEGAAFYGVKPYIGEENTTVGSTVDIRHLAATPIGATVRAEAELIEYEGRRMLFRVAAYEGDRLVGEGQHERYVVNIDRFMKKAAERG
ncbi:MAG: thioesterase family protein [Christensenellales bacterium]